MLTYLSQKNCFRVLVGRLHAEIIKTRIYGGIHIFKSYFRVPVSKVLIKAKESTVLVYRGQTYILIGSGKKITALMETSFWPSKTTIAVWPWNPNPMILLLGVETVSPIKGTGALLSRSSVPVYYGISLQRTEENSKMTEIPKS